MSSDSSKWYSASSKSTSISSSHKSRKHTTKKSRVIRRSSNYISPLNSKEFLTLLNNSLKAYYGVARLETIHHPFIQEDILFWRSPENLQALNNHISAGYQLLHSKEKITVDLKCNVVCMAVGIINSIIFSHAARNLTVLEKVYLFVLSLLYKNRLNPNRPMYMVKESIESQIRANTNDLKKILDSKLDDTKKKSLRSIRNRKRRIENLQKQLENIRTNNITTALKYRQKVDICRYPDCLFVLSMDPFFKQVIDRLEIPTSSRITTKSKYIINQSARSHPDNQNVVKSLHKLCANLPQILKGLIWIIYSQKKFLSSYAIQESFSLTKSPVLKVNLDLHSTSFPVPIVYETSNSSNDYRNIYYIDYSSSVTQLRNIGQNYTGNVLLGCLDDVSTISNTLKLGERTNSKGVIVPCSFLDAVTPKYSSSPLDEVTQNKVITALENSSRLISLERHKKEDRISNLVENLPSDRITYHWQFLYIEKGKVVEKTSEQLWGL